MPRALHDATHEAWIERSARRAPRHVAVDGPDGLLTYARLAGAARALAASALADVVPGEQVGVELPLGARFAVSLHACLLAGAVAVPVDARLPARQRADRTAACVRLIDDVAAREAIAAAHAGAPAQARAADETPRPIAGSGTDAATPAVLLFTSGTTGPGTPVLLSRGALLWNAIGSATALGQPAEERWLSAMPVAHVGGLTVLVRSAIGGTTALLRERFDAPEQVSMLQHGEATITSVVPTMLARLLDAGLDHPPNLRLVLLGGAPIPPGLVERAAAAGVPTAPTYGLSEACSQVLTGGRPLFCTRVTLRSEVAGAPAGPSPKGLRADDPAASARATGDELLVQGPTLALGVADSGGWLATGDRGRRVEATGTIEVIGRISETIVSGGENVAPTEVEAALLRRPEIDDAGVLGVPDAHWGERVEARVVLAPGADLDEAALRARLGDELPPFAVPKRIAAVAALPRSGAGKLLRRELR